MGPPARIPNTIGIFDAAKFERRLMNLSAKKPQLKGARRLAAITACAVFGLATCASAMALAVHVNQTVPGGGHQPYTPNKPVNVAAGVIAGSRISGPVPKYPVEAKKKKVQGTVALEAIINKKGAIERLKAVSGPKILQKSAIEAVRNWKYKPYLLNGKPVAVKTTINIIYSLAK